MYDLRIVNGDINLYPYNIDNDLDIHIIKDMELVDLLVRRAIMTPWGWISQWVMSEDEVVNLDANFGCRIYRLLSDPLDQDWISVAYKAITDAIEALSLPDLDIIHLSVTPTIESDIGMVRIVLGYSFQGQSRVIETNIQ
jgi:hypothetical protein